MTPYSEDLRQRIVDTASRGDGTLRQIAQRFLVSISFVTRLLQLHRATGSVQPRPHGGGNPAVLTRARTSSGSASSSETGPMPRSRSVACTSAPRAVTPPSPAP